ncbi:MAG TPA: RagB/SusD family nutrient uptake outer membrane protein [Chitinophagaceae bacterium]
MKKTTRYIQATTLALVLAVLLGSCKKSFLELQPKGKIIAQNTSDYDLMFNNLNILSNSLDVGIPMGDEVIAMDNYYTSALARTQRLFSWSDVVYDPGVLASEMSTLMTTLYLFNKIANEVPASTGGTDQQRKALLAEAKANRAFNNFWLINMYGKPYNAATAATDPGYPIVTAADVTQTSFTRASVQAVYDFIVQDLTEAIPDLPVAIRARARMGKTAAEALLGKVYIFMGNYAAAKTQLDNAVTDLAATGGGTTLTTMSMYDLNVTMVPGGTWGYTTATATTYFTGVPSQAINTEYICCRQLTSNPWSFTGNELVMSPQAAALFTASDKRLNFFTSKPYQVSTGYALAGALRRNGPIIVQNGETIPELYLLRAECKARLNDLTGAKADLETLRTKRMSAADATVPTTLTQTQMIQFVLNERIREYALQGFRWFDMRRLSVDPLFSGTTYSHTEYSATGTVTATYSLRPERYTMRFPQAIIDQNPGMENNP